MSIDNSWSRKAKDTFAGFVGGATQVLVGQPFDLVKVRLQTGQAASPIEAVTKIFQHEGILAFYKGTTAPLIGVGACVSVQFYAFHEAKRRILQKTHQPQLTYSQIYIAGASAGIANTIISAPVEQLRILLQTQKTNTYKGPVDAIKQIKNSYGLRGLFRGAGITAIREAQAYGIWFLTYEFLMNQASKKVSRQEIPTWKLLMFGGLAGEALWLASYPVDVIKTQIQSDKFGSARKYNGAWDAVKKTYVASGIKGFWKGIAPTLLRAIPASASTFASVELTMRLLA